VKSKAKLQSATKRRPAQLAKQNGTIGNGSKCSFVHWSKTKNGFALAVVMAETIFGSSSPVFKVEGKVIPELARDVLRLEVEDTVMGMRCLRLHLNPLLPGPNLSEVPVQYLDGKVLKFGTSLQISIGPMGNQQLVFDGAISAIEGNFEVGDTPHVSIFAEDALFGFRATPRSKTYRRSSDEDVIRSVVNAHGLRSEISAPGPTYDVVQQIDTDDLSFLRSRAAKIGAEVWCKGNTIHVATREHRSAPELTLTQGEELLGIRVRGDIAHQRHGASVTGFGAPQRSIIEGRGQANAINAEITSGKSGSTLFADVFGPHAERFTNLSPLAPDQGDAWAKAQALRRARRFVTADGTTAGTPEMVVGTKLTLAEVGMAFNGPGYYVTRTLQTFDLLHGHRTKFSAERPNIESL
jgi:uncharacterized protein